jgi:5-methylcytosine-specific restriction endonuclease McrA
MASKRKDLQTSQWRTTIRQAILERDGHICDMCNQPVEGPDATVDHIIPANITGEPVNNLSNLRLLCRSCNSKKGTKLQFRKGFIKPGWGITT